MIKKIGLACFTLLALSQCKVRTYRSIDIDSLASYDVNKIMFRNSDLKDTVFKLTLRNHGYQFRKAKTLPNKLSLNACKDSNSYYNVFKLKPVKVNDSIILCKVSYMKFSKLTKRNISGSEQELHQIHKSNLDSFTFIVKKSIFKQLWAFIRLSGGKT